MIAEWFIDAILLGIVQGIAEFLPVSSSGHLVLVQYYFGFSAGADEQSATGLQMNIALHLGTLGSILMVYWPDIWGLRRNWRLVFAIVLATIPVVIVGLGFKDALEVAFESPLVASCGLLVTAFLLVAGQRMEHEELQVENFPLVRAFTVGLFQALAIVPGISRSGSTIAGGLVVGLKRTEAARFSFLIAVPAIGGASILYLKDLVDKGVNQNMAALGSMFVGAATSFLVGWVSLRWLLRIVSHGRLHWFAAYCAVVGILSLISLGFVQISQ